MSLQFIRGFGRKDSRKSVERDDRISANTSDGANYLSGGAIGRWFRELRLGLQRNEKTPVVPPPIDRNNPVYHSEGRGGRRRKSGQKDHRRHSFNEQSRERCYSNGWAHQSPARRSPAARLLVSSNTMMSARSTPNLQNVQHPPATVSHHTASALVGSDAGSPSPPVRDASSLRAINYGPGHEKFPSWPVPAAAEVPHAARQPPGGGSHRSKSWTDQTNYPKEKVVHYTRPYMKRQHSLYNNKQLKTVMERCEKIPAETFESRLDKVSDRLYFPRVDREGKALGDMDYMVPSPPERDTNKPQFTQNDLEEYARSYQPDIDKYSSHSFQDVSTIGKSHLTQADLEEYTRSYEEALSHQHQKQPSYAQSEGYHSYVSSTDSTATPFLDRLRRDSEVTRVDKQWDESSEDPRESRHEGRDSVVTTSSGSASSSETLKWHGSMSDVSVASSSCTHLANSRQLIAHSARVQTPQRHHSESVLYMGGERQHPQEGWKDKENRNNHHNQLKLFPVNTYTVQPDEKHTQSVPHRSSLSQTSLSVADRVNELERQQTKYTYLDPEKKHRVSDPTLKAIQKKALLSFYERHHSNSNTSKSSWRSEPQLAQSAVPQAPQPPPRPAPQSPSRRASCASDYASSIRKNSLATREPKSMDSLKHAHSNSCGSLSADLLGPVIMGPAISVDDWVPERPPKNPHLRTAYPDLFQEARVPSPDLPPPSPPTVLEDEVFNNDEPLPPPPTEIETAKWEQEYPVNSSRQKQDSSRQSFVRSVTNQRRSFMEHGQRHSQKLIINGSVAISQKIGLEPYHTEALRAFKPPPQLPGDEKRKPPAQLPNEIRSDYRCLQRVSMAECDGTVPPPLHPRQTRINQSMRARIPDSSGRAQAVRASPPKTDDREKRDERQAAYNMSQSKASYLAARREREHGLPTADIGSYKRTMSPSGGTIHESTKDLDKSSHWQPILSKDSTPTTNASQLRHNNNNNNTNNNNILRRASLVEAKSAIKTDLTVLLKSCDNENKSSKPKCNLPDVLPINAKVTPVRPQIVSSFASCPEKMLQRTPSMNTPPKLIRKSSFNSPSNPLRLSPQSPPKSPKSLTPSRLSLSPPSTPLKLSPVATPLKLSPSTTPLKLSPSTTPLKFSPSTTPLKLSPSTTPLKLSPSTTPLKLSPSTTPLKLSPVTTPLKLSPTISSISELAERSIQTNLIEQKQPAVIEGLQLIQRTEVTLRVNPCTVDAAAQTDKEELPATPLPHRRKLLQEEIDCDRLSQDLADHLSPSDRLKGILAPGPDLKKPTDYVSGLFKVEVTSRPRPQNSPFNRSRNNTPNSTPPPSMSPTLTATSNTIVTGASQTTENTTTTNCTTTTTTNELTVPVVEPTSPLSATSTYFTTSESKAKFLTRYSRDMSQYNIVKDTKDLNQKKEELMSRLDKKLEVLRGEQLVVSEECRLNDELGASVERHVARVARPHEAAKFRLHVEEVGKITSLLLGLSGRLARAENALMGLPTDHSEKKILESKRDKLQEQLEEAKKLKESIDKRSTNVSNILYKYLSSEEYADYDHFINMKAKLIMDAREISDKIKLGEEQLLALKETLSIAD